jgi:hypothetical protein
MWSLKMLYHFWMRIFSGRVPEPPAPRRQSRGGAAAAHTTALAAFHNAPVCAAISFFKSPMVSSPLRHPSARAARQGDEWAVTASEARGLT